MKNRKIFVLISLILILSLIFVGCSKKSNTEKNNKIELKESTKNVEVEDEEKEENTIEVENEESSATEDKESPKSTTKEESSKPSTTNTTEVKKEKEATSKTEKDSTSTPVVNKKPTVTITIVGPEDVGTILGLTEVELNDGDTVFDVLKRVVKDKGIQMEYKGRKSSVYIRGIHNIYEFDRGPESGWVYRVNGKVPQVSCGAYKLKDGDKIEWLYTTNLGKEFGAPGGGK
ncbi:uncharacterized protein DUF4430 [Keratinibaculum paraultunense]|uniref:Uncharacterized protein DUF4430 n=1 Tax=Keratinibaculum paraultunense TaxID=1278232 RepID=A0A4R3L4A0_9FIRM|nr:DUF4430 domain-containing protein [Keratinibaculum paraultunense]QQY80150.1 DUF4430 domain-containing protein [Keratinibaculum paraultunense]TCS91529.1 uncharacterized protein DUF4430 [Keratinibaculum paraultunense]